MHCFFVSHLPGVLLDFIISLPYLFLTAHEDLISPRETPPTPPAEPELPPPPQPAPRAVPTPPEAPVTVAKENNGSAPSSEHEREVSENGFGG